MYAKKWRDAGDFLEYWPATKGKGNKIWTPTICILFIFIIYVSELGLGMPEITPCFSRSRSHIIKHQSNLVAQAHDPCYSADWSKRITNLRPKIQWIKGGDIAQWDNDCSNMPKDSNLILGNTKKVSNCWRHSVYLDLSKCLSDFTARDVWSIPGGLGSWLMVSRTEGHWMGKWHVKPLSDVSLS